MARKMMINAVDPEEVRVAILDEHGIFQDFDIETRGVEKNKGNIYKAQVKAVEPSLNAAFVDYGAEKEGFLSAGDVDPKYGGQGDNERGRITDLLKARQTILVQVEKDEVGTKGAVLSTYLSLASRYVVIMPGVERQGVSRRIDDEETRRRMREATAALAIPEGMGVIIRTAGKGRSRADLQRDLRLLLDLWHNIERQAAEAQAPALILRERDMVIRALRDYFTADIDEVIVDSDEAFDRASEYMRLVMPKQMRMLTRYVERRPIFNHYRVEEQLDVLYTNRVPLPSGGSLVIEPTEALVAIDVNSGKQKQGGHEATALGSNLEAAREVARQLRLRDLGGIIVVDFIDMASAHHNRRVEKALRDALKPDKARVRIGEISEYGTLELTRQRLRSALAASIFQPCSLCQGSGHVLNPESHLVAVMRRLRDRAAHGDLKSATVRLTPAAAASLSCSKARDLEELSRAFNIQVEIVPDDRMLAGQDQIDFTTDPNAEAVPLAEPNFGPPVSYEEHDADFEDEEAGELDEDEDEAEDEEDEDEDEAEDEEEALEAAEEADIEDEDKEEDEREDEEVEQQAETRDGDEAGTSEKRLESRSAKRRRRRRERHQVSDGTAMPPPSVTVDTQSFSEFSLPSFELLDPRAFRTTRPDRQHQDERARQPRRDRGGGRDAEQGDTTHGRRRRRRRGGRGRDRMAAPEALARPAAIASAPRAASTPPVAQQARGIAGFFRRLFGGRA